MPATGLNTEARMGQDCCGMHLELLYYYFFLPSISLITWLGQLEDASSSHPQQYPENMMLKCTFKVF